MARPDVNIGLGRDQAEQTSRAGLRFVHLGRPGPLRDTLQPGQRIALQTTVGEKGVPIVVHDPTGIIKKGNRNVRVLEAK